MEITLFKTPTAFNLTLYSSFCVNKIVYCAFIASSCRQKLIKRIEF